MHYVYALYSREFDKIYIGYSTDPEKRLTSHNDPMNRGWTKKFQPWDIAYTEMCRSKSEALVREKQL
ncbi:MAG: GIY-YIG nuclease family protein [Prolixibacteraceae bacterium]|nr:GIY-YIG nuclease family protein [Prolixibacteraceae bacterium]